MKECKKCLQDYDNDKLNADPETKYYKENYGAWNHHGWCLECVKESVVNNFQGEWVGNKLLEEESKRTKKFFHIVLEYLAELAYHGKAFSKEKVKQLAGELAVYRIERKRESFSSMEEWMGISVGFFVYLPGISHHPKALAQQQHFFYKWIDDAEVNKDSPEWLKNWIFAIHEILIGNRQKFVQDERNRREENSQSQEELDQNWEKLNNTEKNHQDLKKLKKDYKNFPGDAEKGKKVFAEIAASLANYEKFHYFPQMTEEEKRKNAKEGDNFLESCKRNSISEIKKALKKASITSKDLTCEECTKWEEKITKAKDIVEVYAIKKNILEAIANIKKFKIKLSKKQKQFRWKPWILGSFFIFACGMFIYWFFEGHRFKKRK